MGADRKKDIERNTAILLAAGQGRRMGSPIPKQYMELCGKPLLAWTLAALSGSRIITDIVLVVPDGDQDYVRSVILPAAEEIVAGRCASGDNTASHEADGNTGKRITDDITTKIRMIVPGGTERCDSVYCGLQAIAWPCAYVFIHDGARPLIDEPSIVRLYKAVQDPVNGGTAIAAVPSKDTVRITDEEGFSLSTPDRRYVWIIQTPQVFAYPLIQEAYQELPEKLLTLAAEGIHVTDDAMLVETLCHRKVKLVEASYRNIKVTTPEDILVASAMLQEMAVS